LKIFINNKNIKKFKKDFSKKMNINSIEYTPKVPTNACLIIDGREYLKISQRLQKFHNLGM